MKLVKAISALLIVAVMAVAALMPTLAPSAAQAQEYRIQPGDLLRVEVLEDTTLNREVLVAPDGRISVPLAGVLRVGGTSIDEAQRRVVAALASNFATQPNVLVSLIRLAEDEEQALIEEEEEALEPLAIYVIGEVNNPGLMPAAPGITLLQSLAMAGGVTDFAATKRIQLRRTDPTTGSETVYRFNYEQVLEAVSGVGTAALMDGDVIVVPARRLFE